MERICNTRAPLTTLKKCIVCKAGKTENAFKPKMWSVHTDSFRICKLCDRRVANHWCAKCRYTAPGSSFIDLELLRRGTKTCAKHGDRA